MYLAKFVIDSVSETVQAAGYLENGSKKKLNLRRIL